MVSIGRLLEMSVPTGMRIKSNLVLVVALSHFGSDLNISGIHCPTSGLFPYTKWNRL